MLKLGISDIVVLFSKYDSEIPIYIRDKYGVEVHEYEDNRLDKSYIPSIRPYLWTQFLGEDRSRENETYFYLDSDVIFREIPVIEPSDDIWYGSDCSGYLGVPYIQSKGDGILESMCEIVGVDPQVIVNENPVCGAQWVLTNPTKEYWEKVYHDSISLYSYFNSLEGSDIQKWTAEMWSQLWNVYYFDKRTSVSDELAFCWATDSVDRYFETNIYHNAGVVDSNMGLFFKGLYDRKSPFEDNLDFVDPTKASIKYVEALKDVSSKEVVIR